MLADAAGMDNMNGRRWEKAVLSWLFIALLIALVAGLIWSTINQPPASNGRHRRTLPLLDERLACGEVDRHVYF